MTYEDFWLRDVHIAKFYREAQIIKNKKFNQEAWWLGAYVFDAVSIAISNAFRGKGDKPRSYPESPYDIDTNKEENNNELERIREIEKAKMLQWMASKGKPLIQEP